MKDLSTQNKIIVAIVALILVIVIAKYAKTFLQKVGGNIDKSAQALALESQGMKQSYSKGQYSDFADQLETAIWGFGTDEDTVYNVFNQMNNDLDVVQLEKAFGIRDGLGLSGWISGDLSAEERENLNSILANSGINKSY